MPGAWGVGEGSRQLGGGAVAFLCTVRLRGRQFPPAPEGGAAKRRDRKWRWESRSPWRRASSGQRLTRMLHSTGRTWQSPRCQAQGQRGLGLRRRFLFSVLHPITPPAPRSGPQDTSALSSRHSRHFQPWPESRWPSLALTLDRHSPAAPGLGTSVDPGAGAAWRDSEVELGSHSCCKTREQPWAPPAAQGCF